jgi:hypothetical protein
VSFPALHPPGKTTTMQSMKTPRPTLPNLCALLLLLVTAHPLSAEPSAAAVSAFNAYTTAVESRLARQHHTSTILAPADNARLHRGEHVIERVSTNPTTTAQGALLHHWRGTAFAPGAHAADFERLLRDFDAYPQHFAPQVTQARILTTAGDRMTATMRIRQHHVVTVVMDTAYAIDFVPLDTHHGYSTSRSTRIDEIADPGTRSEHELSPAQEHGFLWRLNTYWTWEERDGGLYLQIETVSLTRAVPTGLGWAIRPYIESIPRESMEFTLNSAINAIRR